MARVDGETRVYAVLGHPVRHSLSPRMQNAAFEAAGINAVYVALDVAPSRLEEALRGLHAGNVVGLNLTTPHKEAAFRLVSAVTGEAAAIEAVNTLLWERDGWSGHATDGLGFLAWVAESGIDIAGRRALVLGAGGAARSVVSTIASLGASAIGVVSRTGKHAADVAALAARAGAGRTKISHAALADEPEARGGGPWDLLVRALATDTIAEDENLWWRSLAPFAPVLDLNYAERARETRARAAADGRRFEDGISLLLHQGAASFEFWTRTRAPLAAMKAALGVA